MSDTVLTLAVWTLTIAAAPEQAWPADQVEVQAAIEKGKRTLLEKISPFDEIAYRPSDRSPLTTVRGTVLRSTAKYIEMKTTEGRTVRIPRSSIVRWTTPGHVHPEMSGHFRTGPSTLVAFALLSSDVKTTHAALAKLLEALADDNVTNAGTYVRSLRACVWSALLDRPISRTNRLKYRRLLKEDMTWLMKARKANGGYSYTTGRNGAWDNSNTQFADLGLWAGAVNGVEVADRHWLAVAKHWRETQTPAGGWAYARGGSQSKSSMTVAGCNSLYIVLDRYYARAEGPYAFFKGARLKKKARKEMQAIYRAIAMGDRFLGLHPPDARQSYGYELFGLERLGLASGQAIIGGLDWFRHYVRDVARHRWGDGVIADAFALIFLVHGQAPVLMQKLECGQGAEEWNYYHRDLQGLTRYLSRTFERLHRWQRIPQDAGLREMQDAPILYISGRSELDLPNETRERIRQFIERGGTVILHADRASKKFVRSASDVFEQMFQEFDYRFRALDPSHPLFNCHFNCLPRKENRRVPLQALADGPRILVLLCPVDIAGAWHQGRLSRFEGLFQIMANVRVYTAPPHGELPTRLRADPLAGPSSPWRGNLSLRRLPHAGTWNAHPGAWQRFAEGLRHRSGIELHVNADASGPSGDDLREFDVVHVTVRRPVRLDDETLSTLRAYLEDGGLLLIDAADGQPDGLQGVRALVEQIDVGTQGVLSGDHAIARGTMPGGSPLADLETTKAGSSLRHGNAPPPVLTRVIGERLAVLACPFDLIAGVDGHFVWNRSGYRPASTARIVDNIMLWRLNQVAEQGRR